MEIIPREAAFASSLAGISIEAQVDNPAARYSCMRLAESPYQVRVPQTDRLDIGLGAVRRDDLVTYRISATAFGDDPELLFEETSAVTDQWAQRQVICLTWPERR